MAMGGLIGAGMGAGAILFHFLRPMPNEFLLEERGRLLLLILEGCSSCGEDEVVTVREREVVHGGRISGGLLFSSDIS